MVKIVAFSGVQCSGKTTLAKLLYEYLFQNGYNVEYIPSVTRHYLKLLDINLKELRKNKEGTKVWQYFTFNEFLRILDKMSSNNKLDYIITDRWVYDYLVYTKITCSKEFENHLKSLFAYSIDKYDLHAIKILCLPFNKPEDDGIRDTSTFEQEMSEFQKYNYNLILKNEPPFDRLKKVVDYLIF